jgi:hypothetical protein
MIDDMDGNDPRVPVGTVPSGAFYWSHGLGNWFYDMQHGDAPVADIVPPRGNDTKARHVDGFAGDGLHCQLDHPFCRPIDLSMFIGITFWAHVTKPGGQLLVSAMGQCDLLNGEAFSQEMPISDVWQQFDLPFARFQQQSSGKSFDPHTVTLLDFKIVGIPSFDLWIDDLALGCSIN